MAFPEADVRVLRDLAARVGDIAALPVQTKRAEMWRRHNRLEHGKPLILVFPEGSWRELLPSSSFVCTDPFCQSLEGDLRRRLYHWEELQDDNVIDGTIYSPTIVRDSGWGIQGGTTRPDFAHGAVCFDAVIVTEADAGKLRKPIVEVDWEATNRRLEQTAEVFAGVLPVKRKGSTPFGFAVIDMLAKWRGLEQILWDMVDRPDWLHNILDTMTTAMIDRLDSLEQQGALGLNNGADYCGSGGVGFTDELPQPDFDGARVRSMDCWGFATTQIFSEVSPAMHDEFALTYEKRWLSRFGLNAYGCCEPLHRKMAEVKKIPRLRRVSMSAWVDMGMAAAELGDAYVFSRKPNPAIVAGMQWDPGEARRSVRDDLERTRGCVVELVLKDTHTCQNDPKRMSEWVRIAREEADAFSD